MASDPPDGSRSDDSLGDNSRPENPIPNDTSSTEDASIEALHRVELGLEWFHRAHGHLVAFHHNTGHAMDHFAAAETLLREADETALADEIRDEFLPCGVLDQRWSYDVLETFQGGLLDDANAFEKRIRHEIADGDRHVAERQQERDWNQRANK